MPQSWPVALNASGGAPTDTSRRNWCWRAQTSALSPSTMNGRSPNSATPCVRCRACRHCVPASHCRYWWKSTSLGELAARAIDGRRLAALQLGRPFGPRPFLLARVQRAKQAVVLDPPRLLAEGAQRARPLGVAPPFGVDETLERRAQRRLLQSPDRLMVDSRGAPGHRGQRGAIVRRQRRLAAERLELGHGGHADEDRIDGHRADRRVRRLLAGRHLVERQQLQHAQAGGRQPRRDGLDVADVADAPAGRGRTREQRDEQARPAAAGRARHSWRPTALQSKCRRTRATPSANTAGGGSRLTTRNDSRGKSKKYPGCVRTPPPSAAEGRDLPPVRATAPAAPRSIRRRFAARRTTARRRPPTAAQR